MSFEMNWAIYVKMMRDRQKQLLTEAEYERRGNRLIEKRTSFFARARQWLGGYLVRWGWWLAGEKPGGQQLQFTTDSTETKVSAI